MSNPDKIIQFPLDRTKKVIAIGAPISLGGLTSILTFQLASEIVQTTGILLVLAVLVGVGTATFILLTTLFIQYSKTNNAVKELRNKINHSSNLSIDISETLKKTPYSKLLEPKLSFDSFELYISYKKLRVDQMGEIFLRLELLYRWLYFLSLNEKYIYCLDENKEFNIFDFTESLFKSHPEERIYISFAQTGNSIKYQIKSGWFPAISSDENCDILIKVPKAAVITALLGLCVTKSFEFGIGSVNQTLDAVKKYNEDRNRELINEKMSLENEKLRLEIEKIQYELEKLPKKSREKFNEDFYKFRQITILNNEFGGVKITPGTYRNDKNIKV